MNSSTSRQIFDKIAQTLKEAINQTTDNYDPDDNQCFKDEMVKKVNAKSNSLTRSHVFDIAFSHDVKVKEVRYSSRVLGNCIEGTFTITHTIKPDFDRYGGPGLPGKEHGQLAEYPKGSGKFFKWSGAFCKWENLYKDIDYDRGNNNQSYYDRLTGNAAFGPLYGSNRHGDMLKSDRHSNGLTDSWGNPDFMTFGSFAKSYDDLMKSIYSFSLNFKSVVDYYDSIKMEYNKRFNNNNKANDSIKEATTTPIEYIEEAKMKLSIEYIHLIDPRSGEILNKYSKDTLIYVKDQERVNEHVRLKNQEKLNKVRNNLKKD